MQRRMFVSHRSMGNTLLYSKVKIFAAVILIIMLSLFMTGCFYTPDGSDDDFDIDNDFGITLDGALVLRKPFSYDWSGAVPEGAKNYYHEYAYDILNYIFNIYGVVNYDTSLVRYADNIFSEIIRHDTNPDSDITALANAYATASSAAGASADEFIYFYDAMRYQITSINTITEAVDGEMVTYKQVTADSNASWNWSLQYNLPSGNEDYTTSAFVYDYVTGGIYDPTPNAKSVVGGRITNKIKENDFNFSQVQSFYQGQNDSFEDRQHEFNASLYSQMYLNDWDDPTESSEFVDALTYAIYNLVLGVTPNDITISYNPTTGRPTLTVDGYSATADKSSVDIALETVIAKFNKLGSYVGLTARDKTRITDYIIENVIGASAYAHNSRMKYDAIVEAVVNYCSSLTRIGTTEGKDDDDTFHDDDLDKAFPASEIVYFPYGTFFIDSDPDDGDEFHGMPACEYQSVVLMPSAETSISDIWLDFRYDADNDGDEIFDSTKYLDIKVSFRYYKGDGNDPIVKTVDMRVFDGPVDPGEDGTTLEVELDTRDMFGEPLKIGKFEIPEAIDASKAEDKTIVLTGMVDARRYYKLLESSNGVGGYGVLNKDLMTSAYIEIAFDVQKKAGDETTNYSFNVGLSNIFEPPTYPNDPEWH